MPLRLGILLPESHFVPRFAKGYLHALKSGFARQGVAPELHIEHCGHNACEDDLVRAASKLALERDVHAVVAPLNPRMAGRIGTPFIHNGIPLIAHHLGEDLLSPQERFDGLLLHGDNAWLCQWMCGHWAGSELGPRGSSLSAMHEAGYALLPAFVRGLQTAGGGLIGSHVTHRQSWHEDCSSPLQTECADQPDFLIGLYSGRTAASFLSHFETGRYQGVPLIANHNMLTPEVLTEVGDKALGIHSVALWDPSDDRIGNLDFVADFRQSIGRVPDGHALVAYESALLLSAAAKTLGEGDFTPEALRDRLSQTQVDGPRGTIGVNGDEIGPSSSSCGLFRVERNDEGEMHNVRVQDLETPDTFQEQYEAAKDNLIKSGWLNPYLVG